VNENLGTNFNAKDPFASMSGVTTQSKKQTKINDLWGNFTQNTSKAQNLPQKANNNSVDFFNNFGTKSA
jgi:hypothetical protein